MTAAEAADIIGDAQGETYKRRTRHLRQTALRYYFWPFSPSVCELSSLISRRVYQLLDPSQFFPNDAWIFFRLNDAPIVTAEDGDFDVLCLMDAASCYILGNDFVPILDDADPGQIAAGLLAAAQDQGGCFPKKLFVSDEFAIDRFVSLAKTIGAELTSFRDEDLAPFISEAKEEFLAHVGGGRRQ